MPCLPHQWFLASQNRIDSIRLEIVVHFNIYATFDFGVTFAARCKTVGLHESDKHKIQKWSTLYNPSFPTNSTVYSTTNKEPLYT